jgi:DNA polymerase
MNARGVLTDKALVDGAIEIDEADKERKLQEARELTGLDNPKSGPQFLTYLTERLGDSAPDNVRKETLKELATDESTPEDVKRAIDLKIQLSKASTSKFSAMSVCAGPDNRVRGISQY